MHRDTIDILNHLNASFYSENSVSFDRTRQTAWPGWKRVVGHLIKDDGQSAFNMLDVACGNMRFEKYLLETVPNIELRAVCIDSCDELAVPIEGCEYRNCDIVQELASEELMTRFLGCDYDAVVSFGFFHHVPSENLRVHLLEELVAAAAPDGLVAVSLWRFAADAKMCEKAERTTAEALAMLSHVVDLEEGDYLLGWNDVPDTYRYCHSFSDSEIESLIAEAAVDARLVNRYKADGRTGDSNEYLVFRRC